MPVADEGDHAISSCREPLEDLALAVGQGLGRWHLRVSTMIRNGVLLALAGAAATWLTVSWLT